MIPEIDKAINEHCAKEIYDCIESSTKVPKQTLENFIKSLKSMLKSNTAIGPECEELCAALNSFYLSPALWMNNESEEKLRYNFSIGAIHGCLKMLGD